MSLEMPPNHQSLPELKVGDRVRLTTRPAYFKTADPMPMLRPPDIVQLAEEGVILNRHPGDFWSVRFSRGTFLLDRKYLEQVMEVTEPENRQSP
jgi:hypothetical protein